MEPFLDGGMFELIIAAAFIYSANFVLRKKYVLWIYSIIAILSPILLLFFYRHEWILILGLICLFNSVFLVVVLWKIRKEKRGDLFVNFNFKELRKKIWGN